MLNGLINLDTNAYLRLSALQEHPQVALFNRWISRSGDGFLYVLIALFLYLTQAIAYQDFLKVGLLAFLFELPCFMLLKALIKRDRPYVRIPGCRSAIEPSDKFSMPSGHTAAAFLMAGVISYFYLEFTLLAYCWAALIGASRIVLGVHYPSDILAGAALGSSSVFLAAAIIL